MDYAADWNGASVIDLSDLQVFARVAALSSFSEAARALGVPKSNVSRSVARLEEALGSRLFHRSTREVTLTSAGIALSERARDIVERASDAMEYVGSFAKGPRGQIRVNAGIGFGIQVIAERLADFLQRYPMVDVKLDLESRSADLVGEAIDVAVRLGPLPDSSLIALRLGAIRRYLCASPAYLERRGVPSTVEELKTHDIIEMSGSDGRPRPWVFTRGSEEIRIALRPRVTINEVLAIQRLVLHGAGVGILSGYACAPDLAEGRLLRIFPEWEVPSLEVSLVFPNRRDLSPAVRAFAEFLKEITRSGKLWKDERIDDLA